MSEDESIKILKTILQAGRFDGVYNSTSYILESIEKLLNLYKQEKEKNNKIEKYIRSNEWAEDYEKSSCRTKILRILEENYKDE